MSKDDELRAIGAPIEPSVTQSEAYIEVLRTLGYRFRLNLCDDSIEVNDHAISDVIAARIRTQMRDRGVKNLAAVEDAYIAEAERNAYHPIKDYLNKLKWDGDDHIKALCQKLSSDNPPVRYSTGGEVPLHAVYLYRWLLGAVAKTLDGEQNAMLVMDGPQGIGKSRFARWLCSGVPNHFVEGPIKVEDKDNDVRLMSRFIWEVSELDATTRKADVSALKAFITKQKVSVRKAYGRHEVSKPAMCSMVGTVNNSSGFLADETGSRRFYVTRLTAIDWSYTRDIDIDQLWAQAVALYLSGQPHTLTADERTAQQLINEQYEVDTPLDDWIQDYFTITDDPEDKLTMGEIITHLSEKGHKLSGHERAQAMEVARVLTRLGVTRACLRHAGKPSKVWVGVVKKHG